MGARSIYYAGKSTKELVENPLVALANPGVKGGLWDDGAVITGVQQLGSEELEATGSQIQKAYYHGMLFVGFRVVRPENHPWKM